MSDQQAHPTAWLVARQPFRGVTRWRPHLLFPAEARPNDATPSDEFSEAVLLMRAVERLRLDGHLNLYSFVTCGYDLSATPLVEWPQNRSQEENKTITAR